MLALAALVIVCGAPLAKLGLIPARLVGLGVLGAVSSALAVVGFGFLRSERD